MVGGRDAGCGEGSGGNREKVGGWSWELGVVNAGMVLVMFMVLVLEMLSFYDIKVFAN